MNCLNPISICGRCILSCLDIGISIEQCCEHEKDIPYLNTALAIERNNGSKEEEAKTLRHLADHYMSIEKYHEAADLYKKILEIAQETGPKKLAWEVCNGLEDAYSKLEQHNDAMKYSKQGFDIALRTGDSNMIANSYYNLGIAYDSVYEYQNSVKCYNKAMNMFKQLGDEEVLGNCYTNLSNSYQNQGKYNDAIIFQEESLRISDKIGNKEGTALSLHNLAVIYTRLNNLKMAGDLYQQSLAIAQEINHKGLQGKCYACLGVDLRKSGSYQDAILNHEKSLTIAGELGDKQTQAAANLNIGHCYRNMDKYQKANEYYNNSLRMANEINEKNTEALVYFNMADVYFSSGEFQQAISMSEKSLDIALSIGNKECEGKACHLLGQIYHSLGKDNTDHETHMSYMAKSEEYLKKALVCYDYLFSQLHQRDQFKISIFDNFIETFKLLTTVLIETQQTQQALLVTDRGQARALGDRLIFKYGMSQEEYLLSEPLTYPDVEKVLSNNAFTLLHYSLLDDGLVVWVLSKDFMGFKEIDKQQLVSALKTSSGELKKEQEEHTFNCLFADTVARAYKDMKVKEGGENRSLDDCITPKDQCDDVSQSLSRGGTSVEEPWQNSHSLEVLYNVLLAPVLSHIHHNEIVIVPDGKMYTVPFAALIDPNTRKYLSETKRIRLIPSITILKVLQECPVDHHSQQGALIVGNPSVGKVMFRSREATFDKLPGAENEVSKIIETLNMASNNGIANPNIDSLTGKHAIKNVVLAKLKEGAAIIHIAAHGSSDYGEILLSPNISSTRSGLPEEQDYLLTMQEVQQVGIKAQLVVLSCCHSGRGEIRAEGMVGLSRAFLAAGARAVVASLWGINDKKTSNFMGSFYTRLKQGKSASVSLHGALKDFRIRHSPKYWAPFFLIGDDVTITFGQ